MAIIFVLPMCAFILYFAYKFFKLPKQPANTVKRIIYPKNKPILIGHRGGHFEAPENTLVSIKTAYRNGATAVEIDVDFTKDGVPVLHHDDTVDRLTNGTGKTKDLKLHEIKKLNAAFKMNYIITNRERKKIEFEEIPLLIDAIKLCLKYKMSVNLDVKRNASGIATFLKRVLNVEPEAPNYIFVTSFSPHIVYKVRKECPQFATGLIWRPWYYAREMNGEPRANQSIITTYGLDVFDYLYRYVLHYGLADFLGISVISLYKKYLMEEGNIEFWRTRGFEVIVWTVNKPSEKEFFLGKNIPVITDSLLNSEECPEPI